MRCFWYHRRNSCYRQCEIRCQVQDDRTDQVTSCDEGQRWPANGSYSTITLYSRHKRLSHLPSEIKLDTPNNSSFHTKLSIFSTRINIYAAKLIIICTVEQEFITKSISHLTNIHTNWLIVILMSQSPGILFLLRINVHEIVINIYIYIYSSANLHHKEQGQ
jgi:hypothetical protein